MRRAFAVGALPVAIAAVATAPVLLWWARLPQEVAVHWDVAGQADGHTSRAVGLVGPTVLAVAAAGAAAVAASRARDGTTAATLVAGFGAFFAGLFAGIALATALVNRDETRWQDADLPLVAVGGVVLLAVLSAGGVIAVLRPSWLRRLARRPTSPAIDGERVAWAGSCHGSWALGTVTTVLALIAAALALVGIHVAAGGLAAAAILLAMAFGSLRVVVGANGVRVTAGAGWPRVTIPLATIGHAEAVAVEPLRWGGWGYRGSLRLMGRAAWVLRRGEALRLDLTDGRRFAVTVDGADEAAAVVNEWLSYPSSPDQPA